MKLREKLKSKKGETLAEVLCAMLVVTLTSVAFATMVSAASNMNARSRQADKELYAALSAAETAGEEIGEGSVQVQIGGQTHNFKVYYYGVDGELAAYRPESGGGGA